jgi:hypothetical protein
LRYDILQRVRDEAWNNRPEKKICSEFLNVVVVLFLEASIDSISCASSVAPISGSSPESDNEITP